MSNKAKTAKASPTPSARLCMGNPLMNKSAFEFAEEEKTVSSFLPSMLRDLLPFKVRVSRNKIEGFFKLSKKDRKDALMREAMRMRKTMSEPALGHLKKHVCVGLGQVLRLLQRGELCLLILDKDHPTGLDSVLATASASTNCAIMTVGGLGENICKGAVGYPSSAIGFRRSIANLREFDEAAKIARRLNSKALSTEETPGPKTLGSPDVADHKGVSDHESVPSVAIKNVLLKRKDKTGRVFHPPTAHTPTEKEDFGQSFISFTTEEDGRMSGKKRKIDMEAQFEKAKVIVVPTGIKKTKKPR